MELQANKERGNGESSKAIDGVCCEWGETEGEGRGSGEARGDVEREEEEDEAREEEVEEKARKCE